MSKRAICLFKEVLTSLFRIGYPQIFIDRQIALQILFNNLKSKERVLTNKRVFRVEHEAGGVKVALEAAAVQGRTPYVRRPVSRSSIARRPRRSAPSSPCARWPPRWSTPR